MENSAARTYSKLSTLGVCVHIYIHTQNTVGKYKAKWGHKNSGGKYKAKWGTHGGELKLRETRTARVKVF